MDRNAVIGFILIAVLFVAWMLYTSPSPEDIQKQQAQQELASKQAEKAVEKGQAEEAETKKAETSVIEADSSDQDAVSGRYGKWFSHLAEGEDHTFTVETEKYDGLLLQHGGSIKRWLLNDFTTWNDKPLQLIDWKRSSDYNLVFASSDGRFIDTKDLYFRFDHFPENGRVVLTDSMTYAFDAILPVRGDSVAIVKHYVVRSGGYALDMDIEILNMADVIANYEYQVTIHSPAHTERNSVEEASFSETDIMVNGVTRVRQCR